MSWKTLETRIEFEAPYVTVKKDKVQLPDGAIIEDFFTIKIQDASLIVALTSNNEILLKSEYRYACRADVIECPAGMIEANEDANIAAKRELYEETGYTSTDWTYLGPTWESTSKLTNTMHLFLAKKCQRVSCPQLDTNEHLDVIVIPFASAINMVMDGTINANSTAHAILKVAELRKRGEL